MKRTTTRAARAPEPRRKHYAIDVQTTVLAATHGRTYQFEEFREVATVDATRAAKALRYAERQFPRQTLRVRLIQSPLTGGALQQ